MIQPRENLRTFLPRESACPDERVPLTEREADVLELAAVGLTTGAIARDLYVSPQAVTYHLGNLMAKLQCRNRAGLVSRAFVTGLLSSASWPPRASRYCEDGLEITPPAAARFPQIRKQGRAWGG